MRTYVYKDVCVLEMKGTHILSLPPSIPPSITPFLRASPYFTKDVTTLYLPFDKEKQKETEVGGQDATGHSTVLLYIRVRILSFE